MGAVRLTQEESGWCAHNLKTVARKGLWVRVPRPPRKRPLIWAFAILSCHCLPVGQLFLKPLSHVLGPPDSSNQIRVRREIGPESSLEAANLSTFWQLAAAGGEN